MTAPTAYATLTPGVVETVNLGATFPRVIVQANDAATAPVYFTVDGRDPGPREPGTYSLPAAPSAKRVNPPGGTRVNQVKLLSTAAVEVYVEGVPANG